MNLIPIPAFDDNYIWMLHDGQQAVLVDPGDAEVALQALQRLGLVLQGILVTHHHGDHTGGVKALRQATSAPVFGPQRERMPEPLTRLAEGQPLRLLGLDWQVVEVPGHTAGHIAFVVQPPGQSAILFCGDTLFSAGCGRLFEGTPAQMLRSLQKLAALPDDTRVCCAHEYTAASLVFARVVEPGNQELAQYQQRVATLRAGGQPSLPSTIALEKAVNPFLRTHVEAVRQCVHAHDDRALDALSTFAALRAWKDQF